MANKKNSIKLSIEPIVDIKDMEALQKSLIDLKKDSKLYGVNINTVNAALNAMSSLFAKIPKEGGKATLTQMTQIKNVLSDISTHTSKIKTQLSTRDTTAELSKTNKELKIQKDNLIALQKEQSRLNKEKAKYANVSEATFGIKKNKQELGRKGGDTRVEKLWREAEKSESSIKDYGAANGFSEEEIKEAQALQKKFHDDFVKYCNDNRKNIQSLNVELDNLTKKINATNKEIKELETAQKALSSGELTENTKNYANDMQNYSDKASKAKDDISNLQDRMRQSGETSAELNKSVQESSGTFSKAAKAAFGYSIVYKTLQKVIKEGIKTVIELDQSLTDMSMLTGKSRDELHQLIPQLTNLAKETSATITEVSQLTTEYMRQGRTLKDSMELAEQTAKAARIAGISVGDSLNYMTSAINGFNLAASDAERVSDIFAKVGAATATDYEQLAVALSKVSAQANTAGMSIEFTTALLAKGIETTQEAPESIGTALKTVLARMRELSDYGTSLEDNTSINKVERALAAVGVKLRDTNGQFREMEDIFNELGPKWDSLNGMQQQAVAQAVAGTRQQSRFLAIMQDWDRTLEITAQAENAAGATRYQYAKQAEGLQATLTRLTTEWQSFVQQFTDNDLIIKGAQTLETILSGVNKFLTMLNGIGDNGFFGTFATGLAILMTIKGLFDKMLEPIRNIFTTIQESTNAVKEMAGSQKQVNTELEKELTLREQLAQKTQKDLENKEKELDTNKSLFGFLTRGLRQRVKANKDIMKQAKQELGLTGRLSKEEKKQLKNKVKVLKNEKDQNGIAKKKNITYRQQVKNLKAEYNTSKENTKEAQKNLDTANNNLNTAKQNVTEKQKALEAARMEFRESCNAEQTEEQKLINKEKFTKVQQASNDLNQANLELDKASTAQSEAQEGLEEATNKQKELSAKLEEKKNLSAIKVLGNKFKEFVYSVGTAMTNYVTMALAGAAVAFVSSKIGEGFGAITGGNARKEAGENQTKIYENKEKKQTIESLRDEYQELALKKASGIINQQEADRMKEIVDALHEEDSSITADNVLEGAERVIKKLDEQTKELINENKKNYEKINNKKWNKKNQEWLKSDEGISVFQDSAQDYMLEQNENFNNSTSKKILQQITDSLDYEKLVDDKTDMVDLYETIAEASGQYGADIEQAGDNLVAQLKAYNKAKDSLSEYTEAEEVFRQSNTTFEMLSGHIDDISELLDKKYMDTDGIMKFADSLVALQLSSEGMATAMDMLTQKAFDTSGNMTEAYRQMLLDSFSFTDAQWEAMYGDRWRKANDVEREALKNQFYDQTKVLATGMTLDQTGDKIKNLSSVKNTSRDVSKKLLSGDTLDLSDIDTLEEIGMFNDPEFVKALSENPAKAAMLILKNVENSTGELEQDIRDTIQLEEDTINNTKEKIAELEKVVLDENGNIKDANGDKELFASIEKYNQLNAQIELSNSKINASKKKLELLKNEIIDIDGYAIQISQKTKEISDIQKEMSKNGATLKNYKDIAEALESQKSLTASKLEQEWQGLADTVHLTAEEVKNCFTYTEDGWVPASEDVFDNLIKTGKLTADQANYLLEGLDILDEIQETYESIGEQIEENNQEMINSALEAQDYYLEMYKAKLEKENEAQQEALDKREAIYEKYFDSLEGKEDKASYETDRQKLINRIAQLSTATDSASLNKLKEAQQELSELNKERASSMREARREAVSEKFEEERNKLEEQLNNTLKEGQTLLEEFIRKMENGELTLLSLAEDSGSLDGMTNLGKAQFMNENSNMWNSFSSYGDFGSMLTAAILGPAIKQLETAGSSTSILTNLTFNNIDKTIAENTQFSTDLTTALQEILIKYGINANTNSV